MKGKKQNIIPLIFAVDDNYAPFLSVTLKSILLNSSKNYYYKIYVLNQGLSDKNIKKLNEYNYYGLSSIKYINVEKKLSNISEKLHLRDYYTMTIYYRIFISSLFPQYDKVLYLDSDLVVIGDIAELFNKDVGGFYVGAVVDEVVDKTQVFADYVELGLGVKRTEYFNSGVILFDLAKWREKNYSDRIAKHVAKERNNYPAPDQDLLNVVCRGDIFRLDIRYNFQPMHAVFADKQYYRVMKPMVYYDKEVISDARKQTAIYHCFRFLGEFPWHKGNLHPYNAVFDRYLQSSPWKDYRKEQAEAGLPIRIEKVLYRILPKGLFLPIFRVAHRMFINRANNDSLKNETNKLM